MKFIVRNIKWLIPTAALLVYVLLNQTGCVGKIKDVVVTQVVRDTILQITVRNDTIKIPEPYEVQIPVYIEDTKDLAEKTKIIDSLQLLYYNKINKLQKVIVDYENAWANLTDDDDATIPIVTVDIYEDRIIHEKEGVEFAYAIGVTGILESFDYEISLLQQKTETIKTAKTKKNAIALGLDVTMRGEFEPNISYARNNLYWKVGYTTNHPEGHGFKNLTFGTGYMIKF
jgi:hypothetical protein